MLGRSGGMLPQENFSVWDCIWWHLEAITLFKSFCCPRSDYTMYGHHQWVRGTCSLCPPGSWWVEGHMLPVPPWFLHLCPLNQVLTDGLDSFFTVSWRSAFIWKVNTIFVDSFSWSLSWQRAYLLCYTLLFSTGLDLDLSHLPHSFLILFATVAMTIGTRRWSIL